MVELIPVDEAFASSLEYLLKALPLWLFFNENSLFFRTKNVIFKLINRSVIKISGLWRYEDTEVAYKAVGWMHIEESAIWKTLKTGASLF